MSNLVNKIKELAQAYETSKVALCEELFDEIGNLFKEIMADSELIHSFQFTQYTPNYNDGDASHFKVNHQYGSFYGATQFDQEGDAIDLEDVDELTEYPDYDVSTDDLLRMKKFKKILNEIPDDFYAEAYGSSCLIWVQRDGSVIVDEYEHD